jgi:hypothetical protein
MVSESTWKRLFKNRGKYHYYCKIHPFMHESVVVTKIIRHGFPSLNNSCAP